MGMVAAADESHKGGRKSVGWAVEAVGGIMRNPRTIRWVLSFPLIIAPYPIPSFPFPSSSHLTSFSPFLRTLPIQRRPPQFPTVLPPLWGGGHAGEGQARAAAAKEAAGRGAGKKEEAVRLWVYYMWLVVWEKMWWVKHQCKLSSCCGVGVWSS
jgi:hypothetical protein